MNNYTPRNKSNMDKNFGLVQGIQKQRSSFMRSNTWKGTFDCDYLIPCYLDEVLPGDTMDLKMSAVVRLATPLHPIMDNLKVKYEAFFVPMRLVWENTEKFFGEQVDPGDSVSYTIPTLTSSLGGAAVDGLPDYLGLPVGNLATSSSFNLLPLRCYHLIRDEWYRDQNLQDSQEIATDDSSSVCAKGSWTDLHKRNKQPDYLTTSLPWPQKFETTTLPLADTAPVATDAVALSDVSVYSTQATAQYEKLGTAATYATNSGVAGTEGNRLYADLASAGTDVNQFRQAIAIQHANEAMARFGSRYPEIIKGRFGVDSEDSRLQRPELLGMGSAYMGIKTVPQTSETGTTAQGNLAAFGEISISDKLFTKSFTEHGYIMVLISAVGDITYSQNQERLWNRSTKDDFYWIEYNGIGEQAIESREIYADGNPGDDDVFGYQERFGEYRFKTSQVTSLFRPKRAGNLASWHLSEEFASRPTLGNTFIQSNTPMDRAIAVPSEPHLICDMFFQNKSARPMPKFSNPGLTRI